MIHLGRKKESGNWLAMFLSCLLFFLSALHSAVSLVGKWLSDLCHEWDVHMK